MYRRLSVTLHSDSAVILAAADPGKTYRYTGVEIARVGSFDCMTGRCAFTREDFDAAVEAFRELAGKFDAPIKLGHNDDQEALKNDGMPAAGWLTNLRRVGDRLVADFEGVPEGVSKLIENGTLRKRSIEALKNVTIGGRKWPFVVSGLALLGSELPAVDSLKDIVSMFGARGVEVVTDDSTTPVMAAGALSATKTDDPPATIQDVMDELLRLEELAGPLIKNRRGAPQARALFSAFRRQLQEAIGPGDRARKDTNMDPKEIRRALGLAEDATDEAVTAALALTRSMLGLAEDATDADIAAAAQKARDAVQPKPEPKDDAKPATGDLASLTAQVAALNRELAAMKSGQQLEAVTAQVDEAIRARRLMPAGRDNAIKMGLAAPSELKAFLDSLPEGGTLSTASRGLSGKPGELNLADFEPTEDEMRVAAAMGGDRKSVMRQKIRDAGLDIPAELMPDKAGAA